MGKVITKFNFYLYRLKATYQESEIEESFKKSLIVLYNHLLHTYDESLHYKLKELYREHIHDLPNDINYAIVYLVLIDMIGTEKLNDINFEVIKEIIEAFIKAKVNPYNFNYYLKFFLDDEILDMLEYLWCLSSEPLNDYLIKLINFYSPQTGEYYYIKVHILKFLCKLVSEPFSPILKRHFTILGIKKQLSIEISSMSCTYEEQNALVLLDTINDSFSQQQQDELIEKLRTIEIEFDIQKEKAIHLMLKEINQYYNCHTLHTNKLSKISRSK